MVIPHVADDNLPSRRPDHISVRSTDCTAPSSSLRERAVRRSSALPSAGRCTSLLAAATAAMPHAPVKQRLSTSHVRTPSHGIILPTTGKHGQRTAQGSAGSRRSHDLGNLDSSALRRAADRAPSSAAKPNSNTELREQRFVAGCVGTSASPGSYTGRILLARPAFQTGMDSAECIAKSAALSPHIDLGTDSSRVIGH